MGLAAARLEVLGGAQRTARRIDRSAPNLRCRPSMLFGSESVSSGASHNMTVVNSTTNSTLLPVSAQISLESRASRRGSCTHRMRFLRCFRSTTPLVNSGANYGSVPDTLRAGPPPMNGELLGLQVVNLRCLPSSGAA